MNIAAVFIVYFLLTVSSLFLGLHSIPEGHVGVYYRGGALLDGISSPGVHFKVPFITKHVPIQFTIQTDVVNTIACGTAGGTMISFGQIEVVNQLSLDHVHSTVKRFGPDYDQLWIFARIHHEMNQICSKSTLHQIFIEEFDQLDEALAEALQNTCDKWDTGIQIIAVRVTKPTIPLAIRNNYEEIEKQRSRLAVVAENAEVMKKKEETEKFKALMQARNEADIAMITARKNVSVSKMKTEAQVLAKRSEHERTRIDNRIMLEKEKGLVDAKVYELKKLAEGNKAFLTQPYISSLLAEALERVNIVSGDQIPRWGRPGAESSSDCGVEKEKKAGK